MGDTNIVPYIVGSLLKKPQNKVPLIFGNSQLVTNTILGVPYSNTLF